MFNIWKNFKNIIFIGLIISNQANAGDEKSEPFIVSIVPQFSAVSIHKDWTPLLKKLSDKTGYQFELLFESSIPDFEKSFSKGIPDFVFLNPYHMVMAKKKQGYIPLIRDSKPLTGLLFVKKDSSIQSINDLKGKTLGFPAPNAFGASLLIRASLKINEIDIKPIYVNTHSNVYRAILMGDVIAGGGVNNTYQREALEIKDQLRVLYETPESAPHPFAMHPRVTDDVRHKMTTTLLELSKQPENAELFQGVQMPKPIEADYNRDYKIVEKFGIEELTTIQAE